MTPTSLWQIPKLWPKPPSLKKRHQYWVLRIYKNPSTNMLETTSIYTNHFRGGYGSPRKDKEKRTYLFASKSNHLNFWTKTAHHLILQLESYPAGAWANLPHPNPYVWPRWTETPRMVFYIRPSLQGDEGFPIFATNTLVHQFTCSSQVFGFYPKSRHAEGGGLSWTRGHKFIWHPKHNTRHSFKGKSFKTTIHVHQFWFRFHKNMVIESLNESLLKLSSWAQCMMIRDSAQC